MSLLLTQVLPGPLAWSPEFPDGPTPRSWTGPLGSHPPFAYVTPLAQFPIPGPLAWWPEYPDRPVAPGRSPLAGQDRAYVEALEQYVVPWSMAWKSVHPDRPGPPQVVPNTADQWLAYTEALPQYQIPGLTAWWPEYPDRPAAPARVSVVEDLAFAYVVPLAQLPIPGPMAWGPRYPDRGGPNPRAPLALDLMWVAPEALAQFPLPGPLAWWPEYPDRPAPNQRVAFGHDLALTWYPFTPGTPVVHFPDKWLPRFPDQPIPWKRPIPQDLALVLGLEQFVVPSPLSWQARFPDKEPPSEVRLLHQVLAEVLGLEQFIVPPPLAWASSYPTVPPPPARGRSEASFRNPGTIAPAVPPFVRAYYPDTGPPTPPSRILYPAWTLWLTSFPPPVIILPPRTVPVLVDLRTVPAGFAVRVLAALPRPSTVGAGSQTRVAAVRPDPRVAQSGTRRGSMLASYIKDPAAILDYSIDWAAVAAPYLQTGETLTSSVWTVASGDGALTLSNPTNTTTLATVTAAGGTIGITYQVTNKVTTSNGRTDERSILIRIALQ